MVNIKKKSTLWPLALSVVSFVLLPILFSLALANVAPINTAPGVFQVAAVPMAVAVVALVLNYKNSKLHKTTIAVSVISLVLSSIIQLFFVGSAILWSAG